MKYAFYPGCVARGATPELYDATIEVCARLGIDLDIDSMRSASCTGSGVLQEKNERLADTLNARNFALAERSGHPLMTICSTCQGVMSQANKRLTDRPEYLAELNADLAEEGGGAVLRDPGDARALARAVEEVLERADAGRARAVAERFSADAMLDRVVETLCAS